MIGALLGLLSLLLDPLAFVLVPIFAIRGKYPWWMVTPDDPVSPFGLYEPAMQRAYSRGRWWGDVVWLAGRNRFYGLLYACKPSGLMPAEETLDYRHIRGSVKVLTTWATLYTAITPGGVRYRMLKVRYFPWSGRVYGGIFGWKVDSIIEDPTTPRKPINMEGRPVFSPIRVISR